MVMMLLMVMTAAALAFLVVMMVMMLLMVMTAAALAFLVMMMVMMLLVVMMFFLHQILCSGILTLHGIHDLAAGQLVPGGGNQRCICIMLPQQRHSAIQLCLGNGIGTGQNNRTSGFDLIVVELTEVLHIDLDLAGISHCHSIAQHHIFIGHLFHSSHHIGQLTNTGRLNDDTIRMIALDDLRQGLAEIAHQAATDASGVHFGDIDTRILQKAAVDTDLAELIFNEHQLLTAVSLLDHFLNQGCLASAQKAGINVNNSHCKHLLIKVFALLYHLYFPFTRAFFISNYCKVLFVMI